MEENRMSDEINLIKEIKGAEKRAEEMLESARRDGESLIENLKSEYMERISAMERESGAGMAAASDRAHVDAADETIRMKEGTKSEIERIKSNAEKRINTAAELLINKILE